MKMEVRGIGKMEKNSAIMDTDVVGLEWVVNLMMALQNGKKL